MDLQPALDQAVNLASAGALGGGFWGMLIGMLFLNPLLGAALGAAPTRSVQQLQESASSKGH